VTDFGWQAPGWPACDHFQHGQGQAAMQEGGQKWLASWWI